MNQSLLQVFGENYNPQQFFLIAGPCVVESAEIVNETAKTLKQITSEFNVPFILKSSYRKANRTSANSFTGIGDENALKILQEAGKKYTVPTLTDIHSPEEAALAAQYVDILQIPAFLSRQTDLLEAAAKTGKIVNIKKGQFLSAESMRFAVDKVVNASNNSVWLTERGNSFGYQELIVDFRNILKMQENNVPVIMDCTHSIQQPNSGNGVTGGTPQYIEAIAKAAIAVGANGIFIETHPNPAEAKSDGANMLPLHQIKPLLEKLVKIRTAIAS